MNRQKMITVAADDLDVIQVGTLAEYQHKLQMTNSPEYREAFQQEERRPRTLREVLGLPDEGLSMRDILFPSSPSPA